MHATLSLECERDHHDGQNYVFLLEPLAMCGLYVANVCVLAPRDY